jgi:DNA-binding MltR family transcriptional regulator
VPALNGQFHGLTLGGVMPWTIRDHETPAMERFTKGSDRAVAIIAGSLVEARLKEALESRFQRDPKIESEMFRSSGPLGSFSAKIKLAFLIGALTPEAYKELDRLKDVRNKFAHHLDIKDFQSQRVSDLCNNFSLIEKHFQEEMPPNVDLPNPHDVNLVIAIKLRNKKLKQARWRYLMTAMLFAHAFASGRPSTYL